MRRFSVEGINVDNNDSVSNGVLGSEDLAELGDEQAVPTESHHFLLDPDPQCRSSELHQ